MAIFKHFGQYSNLAAARKAALQLSLHAFVDGGHEDAFVFVIEDWRRGAFYTDSDGFTRTFETLHEYYYKGKKYKF